MSVDRPGDRAFARRAARVALLGWMLLGSATAMTFFWGFVRAPALQARSENPRRWAADRETRRGRILDRHDRALAETGFDAVGEPLRHYPFPAAAPVVGYQTWRYGAGARVGASYGAGGAEAAYDEALRGDLGRPASDLLATRVLGRPLQGHDIVLTLDGALQARAAALLAAASAEGAAVVLDVADGAVRALVSIPTFDAAALDRGAIDGDDPSQPLLNRATQGLYPPGSTWKAVTLGSALTFGLAAPDDMVDDGDTSEAFDGFRVACDNNPPGVRRFDLAHAFAYSCNLTFARLGVALGEDRQREHARAAGIDRPVPFRLPTVAGQLDADRRMGTAELASAGFGQGEVLVTPLHMAVLTAAIAGDGRLRRPWLLADVPGVRWRSLRDERGTWGRAMSAGTAAQVRGAMVLAAAEGWAGPHMAATQPDAYTTFGAKTGTAELDVGRPHAWTIAFAPADRPRVAVAVLVAHGGKGAEVAAPIAAELLEQALRTSNSP